MKTQENIAQETTRKQPLMKRIFHICYSFLGTFLFTLNMSYGLLVSSGADRTAHNLLPYFVIPSYFVCVTIGTNYWFGDNVRLWRPYCIASVITFFLYSMLFLGSSYTNYPQTLLQGMVIVSLTVVSTVYSILKLRKARKINLETAMSNIKRQSSKRSVALAKTVRLIALISFSSVFLENAQQVLTYIFVVEARTMRMMVLSEVVEIIIAAYALWLVICFARKEFVQLGERTECDKDRIENA